MGNEFMKKDFIIGGFYLCEHGHGPVKNSQKCPECEFVASLAPDQNEARIKAEVQKHLKESQERFEKMSQVFTEKKS